MHLDLEPSAGVSITHASFIGTNFDLFQIVSEEHVTCQKDCHNKYLRNLFSLIPSHSFSSLNVLIISFRS